MGGCTGSTAKPDSKRQQAKHPATSYPGDRMALCGCSCSIVPLFPVQFTWLAGQASMAGVNGTPAVIWLIWLGN